MFACCSSPLASVRRVQLFVGSHEISVSEDLWLKIYPRGDNILPVPSNLSDDDIAKALEDLQDYFQTLEKYLHRVQAKTSTRFVMNVSNPSSDYYPKEERDIFQVQCELVRHWNAKLGFPEVFYLDFFNMADEMGPDDSARIMSHFVVIENREEYPLPDFKGAKNALGLMLARGVFFKRREELREYLQKSKMSMKRSFTDEVTKNVLSFYGFDHFLEGMMVALGLSENEIRLDRPSVIFFPRELFDGLNDTDMFAFFSLISKYFPLTSSHRYSQWVESLCFSHYCKFPALQKLSLECTDTTKVSVEDVRKDPTAIGRLLLAPRPASGFEEDAVLAMYRSLLSLAAIYGPNRIYRFDKLSIENGGNGDDLSLQIAKVTPPLITALLHPVVLEGLFKKASSVLCLYLYYYDHLLTVHPRMTAYLSHVIPPFVLARRVTKEQLELGFFKGGAHHFKILPQLRNHKYRNINELCEQYVPGTVAEIDEALFVRSHSAGQMPIREYFFKLLDRQISVDLEEHAFDSIEDENEEEKELEIPKEFKLNEDVFLN